MKLEEIMALCERVLSIDETNLAKSSIDTPSLYGKLLNVRAQESMRLKQHESNMRKMRLDKREYYLGRAEPSVYKQKPFDLKILKSEVDGYIGSDDDVIRLRDLIELQQEKINILEHAMKMTLQRTYLIKNAIEFQKLMGGML